MHCLGGCSGFKSHAAPQVVREFSDWLLPSCYR